MTPTPSQPIVTIGKREIEALEEPRHYEARNRPYLWRVASMKKLEAVGLVVRGPTRGSGVPAWNTTDKGREILAARP